MSDIMNIPQIPAVPLDNMQNDLHIGFTGDLKKRLDKARWTDETKATKTFPEPVDTLIGDFLSAQYQEDEAYVIAQGSDLTKQRLEKDRQRDALYKEIRKTVDTFAQLSIFPDKQEAALKIQPAMQKYAINPDGGIEAQTVATQQWLDELFHYYPQEQAARALGIYESLQQLQTLNNEIQQLTASRNDERAQKTTAELKTARAAVDEAFRALSLMLNAQAITTTYDPQASTLNYIYTELIKSIQETIRYYRQVSDDRRRANRRVVVKSDVVGNHQYATVAGWTWERLIQDGKAALAVDTDATPQRIVSTDKKALKAGGLVLALAGVAVSPADEVDSAREYELIAVG